MAETVTIDIDAQLKEIESGDFVDNTGLTYEQWQWVKPRLTNWLYARRGIEITKTQFSAYVRYVEAQCPVKGVENV